MVLKRRPKDNQIGAEVKVDIFVVDIEVEVEMLLTAGEETLGFRAEVEEGMQRHLIHLLVMYAGVRGHLAHHYPQNTTASRGGGTSTSGTPSRFIHQGTSSNRSRGRRTRFRGLNVVYDVEG